MPLETTWAVKQQNQIFIKHKVIQEKPIQSQNTQCNVQYSPFLRGLCIPTKTEAIKRNSNNNGYFDSPVCVHVFWYTDIFVQ